jgi:transcriptional regulator with XRE-family HTH domain
MTADSSFASQLRDWRARRGLSQLALAHAADVSQRHISFLESGRTAPSREMVLRLAAALDLPFREQNILLLAAGFAPAWRERPLDAPELAVVQRALEYMLVQQEPYPAFVVDRRWNLLQTNAGGRALVAFLTDVADWKPDPAAPINLADALIAPGALRPWLANWHEVALYFLRSVHADAMYDGSAGTAALLDRLLAYPDVPPLAEIASLADTDEPVVTMRFRKSDIALDLFTTIATLGTARDVTVQEIRIECFFPADAATADTLQRWTRP